MKYSINISSAELLYLTVEAETELFEARRASNKKSGWGMKASSTFFIQRPREGAACLWHALSADRSEAKTEPFEARRASNKKADGA